MEFIKEFREYSQDNKKPYFFKEKEIQNHLRTALGLYSRSSPIIREGKIILIPGQTIYVLPEDYQTWYRGLENYTITAKNIVIETSYSGTIPFLYYADRKIEEIPEKDIPLFYAYCYGEMLEKKALEITEESAAEGILKEIKLGRGLDLIFDEEKSTKEILWQIAQNKKQEFFDGIKGRITGSWF